MNKIQHAMTSYHQMEGTEQAKRMDEQWLEKQQDRAAKGEFRPAWQRPQGS